MARPSVVVVGGGISGLAAAWELSGGANGPTSSTPRIELIETRSRFGGVLATTEFAGRTIDLGADGFLARRPEATELVRELGIEEQLEPIAASGASLWLRGAFNEIPAGLALGVPTSSSSLVSLPGLSRRARLHARRDELFPRRLSVGDDATIGEIVRTKLGDELAYQFIEPMVGGIQARRIYQLSARSVFPALLDAAHQGGSLMKAMHPKGPLNPGPDAATSTSGPMFYSLLGGMGSLPVELVRQLHERGVVMRSNVRVTALRRSGSGDYRWEVDTAATTTPADALVVATPAPVTGQLMGQFDPALEALGTVTSAGAAMVNFCLARGDVTLPEHGTGVLVPLGTSWSGEGSLMVTAITFLDRKWPHLYREESVLLRAHVGRIDDQRWVTMDEQELIDRVGRELRVLLGGFATPLDAMVQRWPDGLPQYLVGHDRLVASAKAAGHHLRVALAGSAYDGVGVPASIGSGRRAAREALAFLST